MFRICPDEQMFRLKTLIQNCLKWDSFCPPGVDGLLCTFEDSGRLRECKGGGIFLHFVSSFVKCLSSDCKMELLVVVSLNLSGS